MGNGMKRKIMRSHFYVETINQIFSLDTFMLFFSEGMKERKKNYWLITFGNIWNRKLDDGE